MQIPQAVLWVLERLQSRGFECYVVGGCVRDHLLSLPPKDWDVCTDALPNEITQCFTDTQCVLTGAAHGTVTVIAAGVPIEVTTFRTESGYSDHRHPDCVSFVRSIKEDLARRDFTVNAMAYHPGIGLVDPFGGQRDLQNNLLRCVGNPTERFTEDALRIIRALRFCSCYGFLLELSTKTALRNTANLLSCIAVERIRAELNSLLLGDAVDTVLSLYLDVLQTVIPELRVFPLTDTPRDIDVRLTLLLYEQDAVTAERCLRRLRYDNHTVRTVSALVKYRDIPLLKDPIAIGHRLHELGEELFWKWVAVKEADGSCPTDFRRIAQECTTRCFSIDRLTVRGEDLLALGFSGKAVGEMLNRLLFEVIEQRVQNEREQLLAHCRKYLIKVKKPYTI